MRAHTRDFRHKVTVKTTSTADDTYGGLSRSPSTFATIWCKIVPSTQYERNQWGQNTSGDMRHFYCRHISGLDRNMRLEFDGRVFEILGIEDAGQSKGFESDGKYLKITALSEADA